MTKTGGWGMLCEKLDQRISEDMLAREAAPAFGALAISNGQLRDILWMRYAPSDELLAQIVYHAGIRDRTEIGRYFRGAEYARQTMPTLTHKGQIYSPQIRRHEPQI